MSANIPFEIQAEIIKRILPVKSLLRFRSVSKQWKSLIDSSEFITHHSFNQTHQHLVLVRYYVGFEYKYVSIVDDDSFPQHKFSPVVSPTVNRVNPAFMLDCSCGLVCLYGYDANGKCSIVLWNPSIRKSVRIVLPHRSTAVGFGVCPNTSDPKIVKITRSYEIHTVNWKADVFTLSSGAWRSISMNMHWSGSTKFKSHQVVIDGVIHWATYDWLNGYCGRIISFDLTSEEFGEVDLPDSLAHGDLSISKLKESLAVLNIDEFEMACDVWMMMKNGFVKLFSLGPVAYDGYEVFDILGFRKNGQPIREHPCEPDGPLVTKLKAYEPSTKRSSDLGIYVPYDSVHVSLFMMTSYTESLLLLNHSDSIIQG